MGWHNLLKHDSKPEAVKKILNVVIHVKICGGKENYK